MPREFIDPYLDPFSGVMRNKPGIRDEKALREFEYEASAVRVAQLRAQPIPGKFDLDHLKAIHKHVFQDVYDWAGQVRTVNMSKGGDSFARREFIEPAAQRIAADLAAENHLKGLGKSEFVDRLTHHYSELNSLHPFREGNGRSTREFIGQLAREAGYELDQTRIDNDKGRWNAAARASHRGDASEIREFFREAVRPARAVAFEKLPEQEALAKHPELKGAFDGLKAVQASLQERFPANDKAQAMYLAQARSEVLRRLDTGVVLDVPAQRSQAQELRSTQPNRQASTQRDRADYGMDR